MRSPPAKRPDRTRTVFINCPFDADYRPLLRAVCFAIKACGYESRCALDTSDSGVLRFPKIVEMITACDRSIHDISRVELDRTSHLPRFNMPLELGADLGLRPAGPKLQQRRKTLVLDTEAHRYDKTLSDISGMDIEAHGNRVPDIIRVVRDWLNANRHPGTPPSLVPLPSTRTMVRIRFSHRTSLPACGSIRTTSCPTAIICTSSTPPCR
jgi:hypothetical protein